MGELTVIARREAPKQSNKLLDCFVALDIEYVKGSSQ